MAQSSIKIKEADGAVKTLQSVLHQDGTLSTINISKEFILSVMMGEVEGFSVVDKFGANSMVSTSTNPEDVVEQGGLQTYAAVGTAPIAYVSSSEVANTQTVSVLGLDIDGSKVEQEVTLDGQNIVSLTTPLFRADRVSNSGSPSEFTGDVYVHSDPTPTNGVPTTVSIAVMMSSAHQQSLKAAYTIPKGYVGFLYRGELGLEVSGNAAVVADYCRFLYKSRRYGKVFTTKKRVSVMVSQGAYQDQRSFQDILPALTDIRISAYEVSVEMGVWAAFDILLVDETLLSPVFLAAIGQPS